jgi:hypothetical protein
MLEHICCAIITIFQSMCKYSYMYITYFDFSIYCQNCYSIFVLNLNIFEQMLKNDY